MKKLLPLLLLAACTKPVVPPCVMEGHTILSIDSASLKEPEKLQTLQTTPVWDAECKMQGLEGKIRFDAEAFQALLNNCEAMRQELLK